MERGGGLGPKVWSYNINKWGAEGCTNKGVKMPNSVNTGGRAEVMLIQTLETGGRG